MLVSEYQKAIHICEALQNGGKKVTANKIVVQSLFLAGGSLAHVDKDTLKKIAQMYAKNAITEQHLTRYKMDTYKSFILDNGIKMSDTGETMYRRFTL